MLPFALVLLAIAGAAFGQDPAIPLPPTPEQFGELPQYVFATLAAGAFSVLLKAGGIPIQVTHVVSEPDRELVRQVRDKLGELLRR